MMVSLLFAVVLLSWLPPSCLSWSRSLSQQQQEQQQKQQRNDYDSLVPIEETVQRVLVQFPPNVNVESVDPQQDRESLGVSRRLNHRLQGFRRNGDCGRCWLQQAHCICRCRMCHPPTQLPFDVLTECHIQQIFVLMHHKEVCLAVDTAKWIPGIFGGTRAHLVVGGIAAEYQDSMQHMMDCLKRHPESCLVLFPTGTARTYSEIIHSSHPSSLLPPKDGWTVIVLDGTWEQARKLYQRYLEPYQDTVHSVQLSESALHEMTAAASSCESDQQLRRHPILWKQISTLAALRLLLEDMAPEQRTTTTTTMPAWSNTLIQYQKLTNQAARAQLGPPRTKPSKSN